MPKRPVLPPLIAAAVCAAMLFSPPSASQAPSTPDSSQQPDRQGDPALQKAVDRLVQAIEKLGGKVGVSVVEADTGRPLASYNDHEPLNPASNMKLLTAASALWQLSGSYRFRTGLYGKRTGNTTGDLVLRGTGDPSFSTDDLRALAADLRQSGVVKVAGDILVDQSFFDAAYIPPGFDQQPDEWAYFRAPIAAVSLDRNTVTMKVFPTTDGERAIVSFEPPGFVDVTGTIMTSAKGGKSDVALTLVPNGQRLTARVSGSIPADEGRVTATKRVDDPILYAGYALKAILAEQGVTVTGGVKLGGEKVRGLLALHRSAPLSELLPQLGKESDNFYAEMIMKALPGSARRSGLTTADGAAAVQRQLERIGAAHDKNVILNGSGLFDTNRVSAATLTTVLRAAWQDPTIRPEFVAHLAIAGVDGTLRGRLRGARTRHVVRAKTGTLSSVTALSGYVLSVPGQSPIAFSIVVNDVAGKVTGARAAIDKCVESMVRRRPGKDNED
jgi:D-alanyl-D-alanine carboxypeptidase/D-alanyl-D-alanine-endopeptidase (penicillin-binding protein 4)